MKSTHSDKTMVHEHKAGSSLKGVVVETWGLWWKHGDMFSDNTNTKVDNANGVRLV